ncbi:MAG TPA: hypothetical protein VIJ51_10535 [Solirubrobacteraceae bacterium]
MSPSAAAARATAAGAHPAAHPAAPAPRPVGPRRVSGPARPAERVQRPTIARPASPAPFTAHVARVVDHSLLDRLIRGRAWIGLIAFALIGIVAMQVTLLKLNAGIGSSIDRAAALQRESSLLAAQVAGLSSAERVQAEATQLGMVYAPPDDVRYLRASPGDAARAATSLVAPSAGATGSAGSAPTAGSTSTASSTSPAGSTSSAGASLGSSTTSTPSIPSTGAAVTASTGP